LQKQMNYGIMTFESFPHLFSGKEEILCVLISNGSAGNMILTVS